METLVVSPAPQGARRKRASGRARVKRQTTSGLSLLQDLVTSFKSPGFWVYGAWIDTSLRYRAHALGAIWMVAGTLVFVLVLGTLYSRVLNTNNPHYYAHLATGFVCWNFMQQCLIRSMRVFSNNRSMIQNGYVRYADYVLRLFCTQLIYLGHNFLVVVGVVVFVPVVFTSAAWVLVLTVPLFMATVLGACFFFSIVGARYADLGELMQTILRLAFFVTPIIWIPGAHVGKGSMIGPFIYLNPFYYLVEVIRAPLVYGHVPWFEIGVVAAAIPLVWLAASFVYGRARPYIPLWV